MSVRRLREAALASPRYQVAEGKDGGVDNEHEYLRQHVDPVLMPMIEALLLFQPESIYDFICDYVDEQKASRFQGSAAGRKGHGYAKKLSTRKNMIDFMATSVIPVMDDLAKQILREKPSSVKDFIREIVATRIVLGSSNDIDPRRYKVNDAVMCRYKGRPRYYRAVVTAIEHVGDGNNNSETLFTVRYTDGKIESRVHPVCLKPCELGENSCRPLSANNQEQHLESSSNTTTPESQACSTVNQMAMVILIIGIDGAGKTTLMSTLQGDLDKEHVPSAGFTSASFELESGSVTFYDLGGGPAFRNVWKEYYADVHGVIFVVDSSHEAAIQEAVGVLHESMKHVMMANKPLLVFANKRDQNTALSEKLVAEKLRLDLFSTVKCMPCIAKPAVNGSIVDERLETGLSWLFDQVKAQYGALGARVQRDVAQKKLEDQRRRDEQRARVSRWKEERELQQMRQQDDPRFCEEILHESDNQKEASRSHSGSTSKASATPESPDIIYCSQCRTEPAVTKCAASKWMPVCARCATSLKAIQ